MSVHEDVIFLSKEDAANLACVSLDTIERYRDLGLLRKYEKDNQERFSEDDIKLLFNARIKNRPNTADSNIKSPSNSTAQDSQAADSLSSKVTLDQEKIRDDEQDSNKRSQSEELPRLRDIIREAETTSQESAPEPEASAKSDDKSTIHASTIRLESPLSEDSREGTSHTDSYSAGYSSARSRSSEHSEISSIDLLELSRTLKDQLEIVKEERNWLRKRIEKLESLTERDQMLRMSESETIRNLISQRDAKKSPWSFLLSWTKPKEDVKGIEDQKK